MTIQAMTVKWMNKPGLWRRVAMWFGARADGPPEVQQARALIAAGHYSFVCNIEKHYGYGMRADFTVTA